MAFEETASAPEDAIKSLASEAASEPQPEVDEASLEELPSSLQSALYLVGTPIGNLADITLRALHILKNVSAIACEDTRHSGRLLSHHGIRSKLISLNEHNEARRIPELIGLLQRGGSVALISDAGMPTVSDPGQRLVQSVVAAGLRVEGIPGPSAVLTALAASGLPTTPFYFGGFLPHKKGQRNTEIAAALQRECTSVYFESPYRLVDTLEMLANQAAEHRVVVARELTKKFEEFQRGPARNVLSHYQAKPPKGEITLVIAPRELPKWVTW
ncbi:16S rRNA (cytidine1402-2'-O)-methyltransferase [Prosthecobacter debontii]|uniref:Ribosomal RNA small subunit methyltransferase I n=1 Tax=Prosthecobacter debontii TaxID=48467 RepID=A0A1T4XKU7_9BACT|nr:16S rRNA (cytidine(1402)-2'-O)-methyltransferase [Prosthecobacter debontii]SKA90134.1 16S rRNA (cytidine1402-2'-O)-methyltransferase [Prosthecobacter debontii]